MRLILFVVLLIVAGLAYIRLAPSDPAVWNVMPYQGPEGSKPVGDYDSMGAFQAVRTVSDPAILSKLTEVALATPRTSILAGSAEAGQVTFITRSRLFGFPDYTTAAFDGKKLDIWGRLRFGAGDQGVNRSRVLTWLRELNLTTAS